jgi:tetratricopeptide (TPR) repeat protein
VARMADRLELEEQLAQCDEVLREEVGSADPGASGRLVVALGDKARVLGKLGRDGDALGLWDEILGRCAHDPSAGEVPLVLEAGYQRANKLERLGRTEEALAACEVVLARWDPDHGGPVDELRGGNELQRSQYLAATMLVKRDIYGGRRDPDGVLGVVEELVGRYAGSGDRYLRGVVARTLVYQVYWLLVAGRVDAAIAASDALSERFQAEEEPDMMRRVGDPLVQAGRSLGWVIDAEAGWKAHAVMDLTAVASAIGLLDRDRRLWPRALWREMRVRRRRLDQAGRIFDLLIDRLSDLDDPDLKDMLVVTRMDLAAVQIRTGRVRDAVRTTEVAWAAGEPAVRVFREAADKEIGRDGQLAEFRASMNLVALGAVHEGMGQRAEAVAAYTECIERFGRKGSPLVGSGVLLARLGRRIIARQP